MTKIVKSMVVPAETITMTSLELVLYINNTRKEGESELRHDHFLAKVPKVLGELAAPKFRGSYKGKDGTPRPMYRFPKREACLMAMSYSYELQAAVYDRMTALENALRDKQAAALAEEQDRIRSRQIARLECPELTDAIKRTREASGKKVMFFHYSNEFDMINRIALGQTAKQFRAHHQLGKDALMRDHMSVEQTKAIEHLQRVNTALVDAGLSAEQRKGALEVIYKRDHEHLMIAELIQQESM